MPWVYFAAMGGELTHSRWPALLIAANLSSPAVVTSVHTCRCFSNSSAGENLAEITPIEPAKPPIGCIAFITRSVYVHAVMHIHSILVMALSTVWLDCTAMCVLSE